MQRLGAHCYSMDHINECSLEATLNDITQQLSQLGINKVVITFDIDALDPAAAPAVTLPEANGLTLDQSNTIIDHCLSRLDLIAFKLVEMTANHDIDHKSLHAVQSLIQTVQNHIT